MEKFSVFGNLLLKTRSHLRKSRREYAEAIGVSNSSVENWETSQGLVMPRPELHTLIASTYKIPLDEFLAAYKVTKEAVSEFQSKRLTEVRRFQR